MNVTLLTHTQDPLRVLYTAAHTCYSPDTAADIWDRCEVDSGNLGHDKFVSIERQMKTVRGCIVRNHNTVLRHANFTFAIDGISRACANQLTRHGPGWSFDQQSLRYVSLKDEPAWVIPDHLTQEAKTILRASAWRAWAEYVSLIEDGVKAEDARSVLPLCTPTNLVATANLAALFHFWHVRYQDSTGKAQNEIKDLAGRMIALVIEVEPWLAEFFTAKVTA